MQQFIAPIREERVLKMAQRWRAGKDRRGEYVGSAVAFLLGWVFLTFMLVGPYVLGRLASSYLGWNEEPLVFGMLAAIAFVWIYERMETREKYNRLVNRIERLEQRR